MKTSPPSQLLLGLDVPPPELHYLADVVTPAEESALLTHLRTLPLRHVVVHGQIAKRTVARLGVGRDNDAATAPPLPSWLTPFVARVAPLMNARPEAIVAIMVIRYPPAARLGWNKDRAFYGATLAELTLGAGVQLRLRKGRASAMAAGPRMRSTRRRAASSSLAALRAALGSTCFSHATARTPSAGRLPLARSRAANFIDCSTPSMRRSIEQ